MPQRHARPGTPKPHFDEAKLKEMKREVEEEKKRLMERIAELEAQQRKHRTPDEIPSRTDNGRFLPSLSLAYQLLETAERSPLADIPSEEHEAREYSVPEAAQQLRDVISSTLDRVLYTQARSAAAHGRTTTTIAKRTGEFADGVASLLAQQLGVSPYESAEFLRGLQRNLAEVLLDGPITYPWGTLRYDKLQMQLTTTPAAQRAERTSPRATFYRDIADL